MIVERSARTYAETETSLLEAIKRRGMTVFARIDHAVAAREVGLSLAPEEVVVFGSARVGTQLMQDDPRIGLELPLRILLWEGPDGVFLGRGDPKELARLYRVENHQATLEAMAALLGELAAEAAG